MTACWQVHRLSVWVIAHLSRLAALQPWKCMSLVVSLKPPVTIGTGFPQQSRSLVSRFRTVFLLHSQKTWLHLAARALFFHRQFPTRSLRPSYSVQIQPVKGGGHACFFKIASCSMNQWRCSEPDTVSCTPIACACARPLTNCWPRRQQPRTIVDYAASGPLSQRPGSLMGQVHPRSINHLPVKSGVSRACLGFLTGQVKSHNHAQWTDLVPPACSFA